MSAKTNSKRRTDIRVTCYLGHANAFAERDTHRTFFFLLERISHSVSIFVYEHRFTVCTPCVSGTGDLRTDERDILYGGRVLRFVLPDQFNVGRGRLELRRRSGNHARGTRELLFFSLLLINGVMEIKYHENKIGTVCGVYIIIAIA